LRCTGYVLAGEEKDAELLAQSEFERIQQELKDREQQQPPKQSKVYTLYLFPRDPRVPRSTREAWSEFRLDPWTFNPVMVHLPWNQDKLLKQRLKEEIEGVYLAGGSQALEFLLPSVEFTNEQYAEEHGWSRNAIRFESQSDADKASRVVRAACEEVKAELDKNVEVAVEAVEAAAVTEAVGRLTVAREEIQREAARYMPHMRAPVGGQAPLVDGGSPDSAFGGKDIGNLLLALRDIHQIRKSIDDAEQALNEKAVDILALLGPDAPPWMLDSAPATAAARNPDIAKKLSDATASLALALAVYGRTFPILFRVWNTPDLAKDLRPHRFSGLDATTDEGRQAYIRLHHTIVTALNDAWASNNALLARLESQPNGVWPFPAVVTAALASMESSSPSPALDAQAAQERMAAEGEDSWAAKAAQVSAALELLAALTSAAPPVAITLATISFVLGSVDNILKFLELRIKQDAFKATLDPSKALSAEPDYTGLIVGVAFSLLDLKGVRDEVLVGVSKEARRIAETAANGVAR
jgi:hypothetical protein